MFQEIKLLFRVNNSPQESFSELPEEVTRESFADLKNELIEFDLSIDKTAELDVQIDRALEIEQSLLFLVKSRLNEYLEDVNELGTLELSVDERNTLSEIKAIILNLRLDIELFEEFGDTSLSFNNDSELMIRIVDTFPFIADDLNILKSVNYLLSKNLIKDEDIDAEEEASFRCLRDFDLVKNAVELHKDWNVDFRIWYLSLNPEIYNNVARSKVLIDRFQALELEMSHVLLKNILTSNSDQFIIELLDSNLIDERSLTNGNELVNLTEEDKRLCISSHQATGVKVREGFFSLLLENSPFGRRVLASRSTEVIHKVVEVFYLFNDQDISSTLNQILSLLDESVNLDLLSVLIEKRVFSNLDFTRFRFQVLTNLDENIVDMIVKVKELTGRDIRPDDLSYYNQLIQISSEKPQKLDKILILSKFSSWYPLEGLELIHLCGKIVDLGLDSTVIEMIKLRISFRQFRDSKFKGFVDLIQLIQVENLVENFRELPSNLKRAFNIKLIEVVRIFKELSDSERLKALEFYESFLGNSEDDECVQNFELAVYYTKHGYTFNDRVLFQSFESIEDLNNIVEQNLEEVLRRFYNVTDQACGVSMAEYLNRFEQVQQLRIINFMKQLSGFYDTDDAYDLKYVKLIENLDEAQCSKVMEFLQGGFYTIPLDYNQEGPRQPLVFPLNKIDYFVRVSQLPDAKLTSLQNMGQEAFNCLRHRFSNLSDFELSIETFQSLNKFSANQRVEIYTFLDNLCGLGLSLNLSIELIPILNQLKTFSTEHRNDFLGFFRQVSQLAERRSDQTIYLFQLDGLLSVFKAGASLTFLNFYKVNGGSYWNFKNVSIYSKMSELNPDDQQELFESISSENMSLEVIDFYISITRLPEGNMKTYCKKVFKECCFDFFINLFSESERFRTIISELADRESTFVRENLLLARFLTEDLSNLDISDLDEILDSYELILNDESATSSQVNNFFTLLNKGYLSDFNIENIDEYTQLSKNLDLDTIINQFLSNLDLSDLPTYVQQRINEEPAYSVQSILKEYKYYMEHVKGKQIEPDMVSRMRSFVIDQKLNVDDSNYLEVEEFISRAHLLSSVSYKFEYLLEYRFDVASCFSNILPGNDFNNSPVRVFLKLLNINLNDNNLDVNKMVFLVNLNSYSTGDGFTSGRSGIPEFDTLLLSESVNLNNLPRWFSPSRIEQLRLFYGNRIGFSEATDVVYGLFQRFMDTNPVSYANTQKYIDLAIQFKNVTFESDTNSNGASIYRLLARFLLNQVANFLVDRLGPKDKNLSSVKAALKSVGVEFKSLISILNANGFNFELTQGTLSKVARTLRQGKISYLFSSAWAKVKAKVSSRPDELPRIALSRVPVDWQAPEGVEVEALHVDDRERAKLISVNPENVRFSLEMGSGDKFNPQDRLRQHPGTFFFGSLAFSSSHGEITELAFDRGRVVSQLLSAKGKDAFVFVNTRGQLSILDKRNLMLHEVYAAVGLPVQGENRRLNITTSLRDYTLFLSVVRESRVSLLASMMFARNGRGEISSNLQEKSRRMLLQYNNGRVAILDSTDDLSTNEAIQIALSSGELRYAVYMDTGNFDTAYYYESNGDSHQLGHNEMDHLSSNILVMSSR